MQSSSKRAVIAIADSERSTRARANERLDSRMRTKQTLAAVAATCLIHARARARAKQVTRQDREHSRASFAPAYTHTHVRVRLLPPSLVLHPQLSLQIASHTASKTLRWRRTVSQGARARNFYKLTPRTLAAWRQPLARSPVADLVWRRRRRRRWRQWWRWRRRDAAAKRVEKRRAHALEHVALMATTNGERSATSPTGEKQAEAKKEKKYAARRAFAWLTTSDCHGNNRQTASNWTHVTLSVRVGRPSATFSASSFDACRRQNVCMSARTRVEATRLTATCKKSGDETSKYATIATAAAEKRRLVVVVAAALPQTKRFQLVSRSQATRRQRSWAAKTTRSWARAWVWASAGMYARSCSRTSTTTTTPKTAQERARVSGKNARQKLAVKHAPQKCRGASETRALFTAKYKIVDVLTAKATKIVATRLATQ